MPAIVWVVIVLAVLFGALLALDWFTAGRQRRRILVRGMDQNAESAEVGYAVIMRAGDQAKFSQGS